jgi:hypothetical protein
MTCHYVPRALYTSRSLKSFNFKGFLEPGRAEESKPQIARTPTHAINIRCAIEEQRASMLDIFYSETRSAEFKLGVTHCPVDGIPPPTVLHARVILLGPSEHLVKVPCESQTLQQSSLRHDRIGGGAGVDGGGAGNCCGGCGGRGGAAAQEMTAEGVTPAPEDPRSTYPPVCLIMALLTLVLLTVPSLPFVTISTTITPAFLLLVESCGVWREFRVQL